MLGATGSTLALWMDSLSFPELQLSPPTSLSLSSRLSLSFALCPRSCALVTASLPAAQLAGVRKPVFSSFGLSNLKNIEPNKVLSFMNYSFVDTLL